MLRRNVINLQIRRRIFSYISKNPGVHLRGISRAINIPKSTLVYHLNYLKKQNIIEVKTDNYYNRYYPSDKICKKYKQLLDLFSKDIPRTIILLLELYPDSSQKDIINIAKKWKNHPSKIGIFLNKHQTTLSYYFNKLVEMDVIEAIPNGNKIIYRLKNEEFVFDFLITYQNKFKKDDATWRIVKRILFVDSDDEQNSYYTKLLNSIFKTTYEIFPHPYHV
jgi:predicted transcriptional regulator